MSAIVALLANKTCVNIAAFAFAECTLTVIYHTNKSFRDLFLCAYGSYGAIACYPFRLCERTFRVYSYSRKSGSKNKKIKEQANQIKE